MTSLQLIDSNFTKLTGSDTAQHALNSMHEFNCNHLPVVDGNLYIGLLGKKSITDLSNSPSLVSDFQDDFIKAAVNGSAHFLKAVPISNIYRTDVVPVINESEEYLGSITHLDLINALGNFCGAGEYGALIVLQIEKPKLIFSELNSIVESDGATILHYNVSPIAASPVMEISIGIDKKDISTILATFNRYNYKILFTSGEDLNESEISDNYDNLMNYLGI
jgi:CBS domain-containing protein